MAWTSQDMLDLGPWNLTLPPWHGHPRMSWDILGQGGPGTLGPYTASMAWTSQDMLDLGPWDLTLPLWHGCPGIFQDMLDLGPWDPTLPPCCGMDIPGHVGRGTLGPYTASMAWVSQDVLGHPRTCWTWDPGTLHCLHSLGCPRICLGQLGCQAAYISLAGITQGILGGPSHAFHVLGQSVAVLDHPAGAGQHYWEYSTMLNFF